ncbi:cell wall-binding repeat-containing protein [Ornithinimicrobium flavum]|uniref:cell wall-binding repeat-containing protein n=1 Tax=Ornithinimicrobium flavum TaxID=1288636 RepID=UPI0010701FC0|nr:cell wall-binding repeat-containing protein [Ornithinimicrobium flavum]
MGAGRIWATGAALAALTLTAQGAPAVTPGAGVDASPVVAASVGAASAGVELGAVAPVVAAEEGTTAVVGPPTSRLSGADRYASAVAISQWTYADPSAAEVVYLARGDVFADALTAGTLSDGPVLLTRGGCQPVPSVVLAEVDRVDPDAVIAIGGTAAVCDEALADAAQGRPTGRLAGADRQETAALIAQRAFPDGAARVYLTRGAIGPDAVAAGSLRDGPTLLLSSTATSVPAVTASAIDALDPSAVVALGGTAAVPEATLQAAAEGRPTARLAGSDRYGTAVAIARHAYPSRTTRVYLARGDGSNFVDAVASGMLTDGPVLLTPGTCERVRGTTDAFLEQRHPGRVVALGGPAALCGSTLVGVSIASRPAVNCAQTACIALTFDDGPAWPTPILLDTLAGARVPVTFFVVGQQVDANGAYSRRAHVEGHAVENHTWSHPELPTLTWSQQKEQTERVETELGTWRLQRTDLLRPPYGSYNTNTRTLGYPLILWDVDPEDWKGYSSAYIRNHVATYARSGSIVLQHDLHINSVNAVPGIISDLHSMGYTLVTVEELVPDMQPGDLVYRRDHVVPRSQPADASDPVVLPDGTDLGRVLDGAGVDGIAPERTEDQLLETLTD